MVALSDIGWGSYLQYSGPWYRGSQKIGQIQPDDILERKFLQVITATEGGAFDAINMYDRMIMTVGLIQFGDAGIYLVCDMLGEVVSADFTALDPVRGYVNTRNYVLIKTSNGKWRFSKNGDNVDTIKEQQDLYLGGSDGVSWTDDQKQWAKGFAAAMANVFSSEVAKLAQMRFTMKSLQSFVFNQAHQILFTPDDSMSTNPIIQAAQAAYISFAANLPAVANSHIQKVDHSDKGTMPWFVRLLKQLTFGPQIAIYPTRYNMIRPHLERLWGLNLPDMAAELAQHQVDLRAPIVDTTVALQKALIAIGYDLGPSGADGVDGPKTKAAVIDFQSRNKLTVDGIVGKQTRAAIEEAVFAKASGK